MVSSGLAPHKLPRALDSLLIYQQPSSTTLYYSYPGILTLIEVRSRNGAGEITCVNALARVTHLASSGSSTILNAHNRKGSPRHNNALLCLVSLTSISWTGWRRASTTGNCYLAVISTVFVNHIALLLRTIILYRIKGCLLSFVCVSHFLKTVCA